MFRSIGRFGRSSTVFGGERRSHTASSSRGSILPAAFCSFRRETSRSKISSRKAFSERPKRLLQSTLALCLLRAIYYSVFVQALEWQRSRRLHWRGRISRVALHGSRLA